jgi:hypothetical protein
MKWTKKLSQKFDATFAGFETHKSRIERKELLLFLEGKDAGLAKVFGHFARNLTPGEAIACARTQHVCAACQDVFVQPRSNVCRACRLTPEGKNLSTKLKGETLKESMSDEKFRTEVNEKKRATSLKNFGTEHPRQNKEQAANHSKAMRSERTRQQRKETCLAKWGVEHPAQHPEVLKKMLNTALQTKQVTVQGKHFTCQGYEPFVLQRLAKTFGVENIVGQFDKEFKPIKLEKYWLTPDFYVKSKAAYVEVKSLWTLGIRGKTDFLQRNRQRQLECNSKGIPLKFIVYIEARDECVQLPKEWFKWSSKQLTQFINTR